MHTPLLILDVDGVLTDGGIILDDDGRELKRFHVTDGFAMRLWDKLGLTIAIITGRSSGVVKHRMNDLKIPPHNVFQGSPDKLVDLQAIWSATGYTPEQTAYVGDDWPDLQAMKAVAYPIAPSNARPEIKAIARYTTAAPGGQGAVREAIEHLLVKMNRMEEAVRLYDPGHGRSSKPTF